MTLQKKLRKQYFFICYIDGIAKIEEMAFRKQLNATSDIDRMINVQIRHISACTFLL